AKTFPFPYLCSMERKTFADFKFNRQNLNAIEEAGYTDPTPIQQKAIPPILSGQDAKGVAQTGTAKTAAFVLPLLMKLKYAQGDDPRVPILSPPRELAIRSAAYFQLFATSTDVRTVVLYG